MKKKDKREIKRSDIRLKNIDASDLDIFEDEEAIIKKKTTTKIEDKYKITKKSGVNLKTGRVIKVLTNYRVQILYENKIYNAVLSGRLKQIAFDTRKIIAVGDLVNFDISAKIPRVEEILNRKNIISRYNEGKIQKRDIIAANIDYLIITASYKEPSVNYGLIDRYICAAEIQAIKPIICINKIDLKTDEDNDFEENIAYYKKSGYEVVLVSAKTGYGLQNLKLIIQDKISVFSGHSGVGKSSIINKLQPNLNLSVNKISNHTKKGVHTTTTAVMIPWDFGGFLIDTPGIKTFTLHDADKEKLPKVFPGFKNLYSMCKFSDCTHIHENDCAVKNAVYKNKIPSLKYTSYLRIYNSLKG